MDNNQILCIIESAWKEFERTGEIANNAENILTVVGELQKQIEELKESK